MQQYYDLSQVPIGCWAAHEIRDVHDIVQLVLLLMALNHQSCARPLHAAYAAWGYRQPTASRMLGKGMTGRLRLHIGHLPVIAAPTMQSTP